MSLCSAGGRAGELADDLLEDVFQRHQSLDVAVFVDDERDAAPVALEVEQLHVERRAFRHEVRFALPCELQQVLAIEVAACERARDLLHVQDADDVVEVALAHRQACAASSAARRGSCPSRR